MGGLDDERPDRRQALRREEDQALRDEVEALRFAVFGHKQAPETGLMSRHQKLEKKIDRNTWALVAAALMLAGAIVQNVFS